MDRVKADLTRADVLKLVNSLPISYDMAERFPKHIDVTGDQHNIDFRFNPEYLDTLTTGALWIYYRAKRDELDA